MGLRSILNRASKREYATGKLKSANSPILRMQNRRPTLRIPHPQKNEAKRLKIKPVQRVERLSRNRRLAGAPDQCYRSSPMTSNSKALAGLRIAVGMLFLIFAEYKVFGSQFTSGGKFQYWINRFLEDGAYPFMAPVLKDFVLPHARSIAFLVAYGELAIGLALVFGILVRSASVCGLTYMLTLLFASNYPGPHAAFWQYFGGSLDHLVLAFCFATFMVSNPEEVLSLSTYLRRCRATREDRTRSLAVNP